MIIRISILYYYPRGSDVIRETFAETFDIVDIADKITLRMKIDPNIDKNFEIFDDPFDQPIIFDLDWDSGEFTVFEGYEFFEKLIKLWYIPKKAQIFILSMCQAQTCELRSVKKSIDTVRSEHDHLANVNYEDWPIEMKVLEKMYRTSCS